MSDNNGHIELCIRWMFKRMMQFQNFSCCSELFPYMEPRVCVSVLNCCDLEIANDKPNTKHIASSHTNTLFLVIQSPSVVFPVIRLAV